MIRYIKVIFQETCKFTISWTKSQPHIIWNHVQNYHTIGNWVVSLLNLDLGNEASRTTLLLPENTYMGPSTSNIRILNFKWSYLLDYIPYFDTTNFERKYSEFTVFWHLKCQMIGTLPINIMKPKYDIQVTTFSAGLVWTNITNNTWLLPISQGNLGGSDQLHHGRIITNQI